MSTKRVRSAIRRPTAKEIYDFGVKNYSSYRMPQTAISKYNGGDTKGFLDDLLGWASYIPGAGKYVDMINLGRKTGLGKFVEEKVMNKFGKYVGEGPMVDRKMEKAVVKAEEKKIVKEAIKTGSRKIANISRTPRVLRSVRRLRKLGVSHSSCLKRKVVGLLVNLCIHAKLTQLL